MKTLMKTIFCVCMVSLMAVTAATAQNYRIKQRMTMNGRSSESTVLVRGPRKRTSGGGYVGMGGDVASVEQCDLHRTVQINDKKKLYYIEPDAAADTASTPAAPAPGTPKTKTKTTRGGIVTMSYAINDTAERKTMFGLTARHIKTSMTSTSSPDACSKNNMAIETDGWYVDLPQFSCPISVPKNPFAGMGGGESGGCRDQMRIKQTGTGKLGFALSLTQKMKMDPDDDDDATFTQTIETLEFTSAAQDAAPFDVPKGYTEAASANDLYDRSAAMGGFMPKFGGGNDDEDEDDRPQKPSKTSNTAGPIKTIPASSTSKPKKNGTIRIGVYMPVNHGDDISITNMHAYLAGKLTSGNFEAVQVSSEADARSAGCDYVLNTNFSKLRQSTASKIGGMFGKITNTDTSAARTWAAEVNFTLAALDDGRVVFQNKAVSNGELDVDRAAESALAKEAAAVISGLGVR